MILYRIGAGRVVIILAGRFAGRKAVVVRASEEGVGSMKFGHATGIYFDMLCSFLNIEMYFFLTFLFIL